MTGPTQEKKKKTLGARFVCCISNVSVELEKVEREGFGKMNRI